MKYAFTILYCLSCTLLFSQKEEHSNADNATLQKQITFRDVTVENGLSQNSVVSIAQDSIGYLWFATQDGLNRYDGKIFKYYNKRFDDITRPTYSQLGKTYVDREGELWIISTSGILEKYDKETDVFVHQVRFKNVSSIYQDHKLDYFIGTFGEGLYKISTKKQDTIKLINEGLEATNIYGLYNEKDNLIVMSSKGLVKLSDNHQSILRPDLSFSSAANAKSGRIWFGTFGNGLYFKELLVNDLRQFNGFGLKNELPENLNIQSLLVDKRDRLWIATYGNGVYLVDSYSQSIRHFVAQKTNPFALHYNDVLCLYEDFAGTIWLGTDGAGLSYYDENLSKFNILTNSQIPENVNVDVIRAITVDRSNTIWLGTSGKGLTSYNVTSDSYKTYTTTNSNISSNRVMSLFNDANDLWIGFQGDGLNILKSNGDFESFEALKNITIWKIYRDSGGRTWLCTRDNGLLQFDKIRGIITSYNTENSNISTNNIRTIEEISDGAFWIGSESNGLFKLDAYNNQIFRIDEVQDNIKSLYQAKNGILWIGTNGNGLKAFNPKTRTVKKYDREYGLPNNVIYSVLPDDEGDLWLSSNRGITKLVVNENSGPEIVNYNNYDGLQALEFNTGAYFKDKKGYLYFGGLDGLNWFKPDALTKNPIPPKTVINRLEIFSEEHQIVQDDRFKHNQNTMTFAFAGLHYSLPERNNYKYKLTPYDDFWIDSKNTSTVQYPKLPPDDYIFQVKSSNYDNVWNEEPATYRFKIKQPWYFGTLAKVLYIVLLILSGILIYRYLKWRWHVKMQLQFEHAETKRLKKLDETKSRLYTNISHEFRTPLTLISGPIDKQLSKADLKEEDKKELSMVQRNAKRLLNLVNQMLDLSKLESGSFKLSVTEGKLEVLLKQITAAFKYKAEDKDIDFKSKILTNNNAWYDKDIIEKIVTNLLGNAIKYAPEGGRVTFETMEQDGQLIITVINNGNTITDEELGKLFQRFYQTNKSSDGVGIGLSLVKELAILSHGNIVAHNMNEDDIQFTVTLPIERSFYNQSEIVFNEEESVEHEIKFQEMKNGEEIIPNSEEMPVLLVVEDDADVRQYIVSIFKKDYNLLEASNGKEGIEKALKYIPDLVISDIMMPLTDGIEVCNTLKNDEKTSHIPIVLLTAKVGEENEIKGLKTGADAYVTKPFSNDKLLIIVEKLIELRRQLQKRYSHEIEVNHKELSTSTIDQKFLQRMQKVLDECITEPDFTSEILGEKMLLSRMQLHRKLKAMTGLSTSEFLRSQRLKLALKLLKESDLTVSEIAYQVGFNTPSYFTKCFKAVYKCTPNEYLERI